MNSDFTSESVAHGLSVSEFSRLDDRTRKHLVRLLARVSEKSYRRGFQQGIEIGHRRIIDPAVLRFQRSLENSPYTDSPGGMKSVDRLFTEFPVLMDIGFFPDRK